MKKICVMHRASIGDTLLATPIYRALKENFPDAEIIAIVSPVGYELLQNNLYIDTLIKYQKGDSILSVVKKIFRADVAIILDYHYRNALLAFLAMIPKRIGRGKDFINCRVEELPLETFEPIKYLSLLKPLGISTDNLSLAKIIATDSEKIRAEKLIAEIKNSAQKLVLIAPISLSPLKDWSAENYREIIRRLQNKNCVVAMIGGNVEREIIEKNFPGVINFAGKTNLRESAEIISRADFYISGCTAMLHVCSTTKTPAIAIYGPTNPAQWAPKNCTVITHNFDCSPCYNIHEKICDGNKCIQDISVDEVWSAIEKILAEN